MKKSTIFLSLLSFILLLVIILLGIFLLKSTSDYAILKEQLNIQEISDSEPVDLPLQIEEEPEITTEHFIDNGIDVDISYPSNWKWELDTQISEDFPEGSAFKSMEQYNLEFTNGTSKISFSSLFGAVGDIGVQYPESEYETKVLNTDVIRVKQNGESDWRYLAKIPCTDAAEWDGVTEVCGAGGFFPGFAKGGASTVSYSGSDALLEEVDAIVLTAN
jgi:hypothetical protein